MIYESVNHEKIVLPPSTMLNPTPVVMVSCAGKNPLIPQERPNIVTIAWAGTVCSEPPMVSISVRPSRHSYGLINDTQEFVINLVNEDLLKACDYCGVRSGDKEDKFASMSLTSVPAEGLDFAPAILESPLSLACKVVSTVELGTHVMFVAKIVGITADMNLFDKEGKLCLEDSKLITYSHGEYYALGKILGFFGHSVASPEVLARRTKEKAAKEKEQAASLDLAASTAQKAIQTETGNAEHCQKPDHKKTEFKKSRYSVSGPRKPGFSKSDEGAARTAPRKPSFSRSGPRDAGSRDSRSFTPREGGNSGSAPREGGYSSSGPRKGGYSSPGSQKPGFQRSGPRDGGHSRDAGSRDSRNFTPREGGRPSFPPREGGNTSSAPQRPGFSKPGFSKPGFRKTEQGRDRPKPEGGRGRFDSSK